MKGGVVVEYAVRWTGDETMRVRRGVPRVTNPITSLARAERVLRLVGEGRAEIIERRVEEWRVHDLIECGCELTAADIPTEGGR